MEGDEAADRISLLRDLGIWAKIADKDMHLVTKKDVAELFKVLDDGRKGHINTLDLMTLQAVESVKLTESDLKGLVRDADRDGNGQCTADDLYDAIVHGVLAFSVVKEALRKKEVEIKSHQVEREKLLEWMKFEYETSTALWSLPMTIGTFVAFSWVAATHIDLFHSWRVHNALIDQFPTQMLPRKKKDVDIPTLNRWTLDWYIPTVFKQDPIYDPLPGRLAAQNQMITGVRFAKSYYDPSPCPTNDILRRFFNSKTGQCFFEGELKTDYVVFPYQVEKNLLLEQFRNMTQQPWLDEAVQLIEYQTFTYNANINLFTLELNRWTLGANGLLKHRVQHESIMAEPYAAATNFIPDVIFVVLTLRTLYSNMKEVLPAIMAGLDGFINYLTFFKVAEWISLLFASFCFSVWILIYLQIVVDLPEALAQLPKGEFDRAMAAKGELLGTNLAYLNLVELQEIMSISAIAERLNLIMTIGNSIRDNHEFMRNMFALNFLVMIFRFFKSFQANPWLDIVVQTIVHCTPNVAHFFIVFSAIFTCYAYAGHFLLGNVIKDYSTTPAALFSRYRTEIVASDLQELPVAHQVLGYTWVLSYQLLVSSLILSMLIGIVFGSYYAVQKASRQPMPLWTQVRKAIQTAAETRSFLSLWSLIVLMEDDDYPAHPNKTATSQSLKKAFEKEKMTRQNAEYLIRKAVEYVKDRTQDPELDLPDAVKIIGNSSNLCQKHEEVLLRSQQLLHESMSKGAGNEGMIVGLVDRSQVEPEAKDEPKTHADLLDKGLENLTSMFHDLQISHETTMEKFRNQLQQERTQAQQRHNRLHSIVEEFNSRLQRTQRGVVRLVHFMGNADFGSISNIPEQMENDVMRCFGSRPALAREQLQPGEVFKLEQQCREVLEQLMELSSEFGSLVECQPTMWNISANCGSLVQATSKPGSRGKSA